VFAHAPMQLFLPMEDRKQILKFGFGILPGAYAGENKTNGVLFRIWLETADGRKTLLWSRMLNPLEQPQDREHNGLNWRWTRPRARDLFLKPIPPEYELGLGILGRSYDQLRLRCCRAAADKICEITSQGSCRDQAPL